MSRKTLLVPLVIICAGIGWLLNYAEYYPHVNWIVVLGLAGFGAGVLIADFNKVSFVSGFTAFAAAAVWYMWKTDMVEQMVAIILLLVAFGGLLFASRVLPIPQ